VVEILKALYRGAEVLILDEPTSALAPVRQRNFSPLWKPWRIMILPSFRSSRTKLPIVLAISDRVTVLRRGKVVSCTQPSLHREEPGDEMVGREVIFRIERTKVEKGKTILEVENLSATARKGF